MIDLEQDLQDCRQRLKLQYRTLSAELTAMRAAYETLRITDATRAREMQKEHFAERNAIVFDLNMLVMQRSVASYWRELLFHVMRKNGEGLHRKSWFGEQMEIFAKKKVDRSERSVLFKDYVMNVLEIGYRIDKQYRQKRYPGSTSWGLGQVREGLKLDNPPSDEEIRRGVMAVAREWTFNIKLKTNEFLNGLSTSPREGTSDYPLWKENVEQAMGDIAEWLWA